MVQWKLNLIDPQTLAEVVVWLVTHILQNKIQQDPRFLSRFYRPTKYLNYDIAYLRSHYRDESRALVDTPYSEMLLWLGESWDETVNRVKKTSVVVNPKRFRVISPIRELETFRSEALREFKQDGKATFNGHAIRLSQVEEREEEICLHVQPTRYYEQVKSNMVMDWEGPHSLQGLVSRPFGRTSCPNTDGSSHRWEITDSPIQWAFLRFYTIAQPMAPPMGRSSIFRIYRAASNINRLQSTTKL